MYFWFGAVKGHNKILIGMLLNLRLWYTSISDIDLVCAQNNCL